MSPKSTLYLAVSALGFGSAFAFANVAVDHYSALHVAVYRSIIAMAATSIFILLLGVKIPLTRRHLMIYFSLGALTMGLPFILMAWSQLYIDSSLAGVIYSSMPLLTLILTPLFLGGGKPHMRQLIGAAVGMFGVSLAATGGTLSPSLTLVTGVAIIFLSVILYALGGVFVKKFSDVDPRAMTFGQLAASTLFLGVTAFFEGSPLTISTQMSANTALLSLGVIATAIPMMSLFLLIKEEGPVAGSLTTFFVPFLAIAIGAVFLKEQIPQTLIISCILVVGGAWFVVHEPETEQQQTESST